MFMSPLKEIALRLFRIDERLTELEYKVQDIEKKILEK